jgi:hypothetical protein
MMSPPYQYPETVNQDDQFTPELMELWDESIKDLKARRNRALLWQVPAFIIFWILGILIFGEWVAAFAVFAIVIFGLVAQAVAPQYEYTASSDRSSAKFELSHTFKLQNLFAYPVGTIRRKAEEGMEGLLVAIVAIVTLPIWWGWYSICYSGTLFNYFWWLKAHKTMTERLRKIAFDPGNRQHIRGTNILPSVQLSGTPAGSTQQQPLEVFGKALTLLPDGGIVIAGGAAFDQNSTFSNFSVNGLALTRDSREILKVSHDGSNYLFRFDGNSWAEG